MEEYAYHCGVMDAFNEVIKAGVKKIALSHPFDSKEDCNKIIPFCQEITQKYGNSYYVESELLTTDLFPVSANVGKTVILFYRDSADFEAYLKLKQEKQKLIQNLSYMDAQRKAIAIHWGRLLSYSEEMIQVYIEENTDCEKI